MDDAATIKSIRELRALRLWSARDLAAAAGLSLLTVYRIERGAVRPRNATIRSMCDALEVEPSEVREFVHAISVKAAV